LDTISRLSEKQKDCLRLIAQNMNSKQIARELKISEHTVDQRVRQSLRILNVTDRFQAARAYTAAEIGFPYQPLIYQPDALARPADSAILEQSEGQGEGQWMAGWFPPLGGKRHDLDRLEIVRTIVRFAFVIGGGSAVIVVIGLWLMSIFA
jgi:DNA-binding CsgD family transcriptional regulator